MDNVVAQCKKRGVTRLDAYVDNVSISTLSLAEHCNTLAILLTVLDDLGMSLRHGKCEFATSSIRFLGFRLDGQTIKPSLKNIDKIKEFPNHEKTSSTVFKNGKLIGVSSKSIHICANHEIN